VTKRTQCALKPTGNSYCAAAFGGTVILVKSCQVPLARKSTCTVTVTAPSPASASTESVFRSKLVIRNGSLGAPARTVAFFHGPPQPTALPKRQRSSVLPNHKELLPSGAVTTRPAPGTAAPP